MATTIKVYANGNGSRDYVDFWIVPSGGQIIGDAKVSFYTRMDGSTEAKLLLTTTFSQVDGKYTYITLGAGHYGQAGASIDGVTDGIVWADSMWSTYPSQSDLQMVRTGENTAEIRGTNWVDYVTVEDKTHWVRYESVNEYYDRSSSYSLPVQVDLDFRTYQSLRFKVERGCWSCSDYPEFFGNGATYYPTITNPLYFTVQKSIVAPNAPTITQSPASVVSNGSAGTISWSRNHPDLTEQGSAQVKIDASTYEISGSVATYQIPSSVMSSLGYHTISVRTQNAISKEWGVWSATITFQVRDLPSLSVSSPTNDYVLQNLPLGVQWYCDDATGISQQTVEVLNSLGSTVWQASVPVGTMNVAVGRNQYYLESGLAYSVRVTVTNGVNLSSFVTVPFTVLYVGPENPDVTVAQGAGCAMSVYVEFVEASGKPDVETADVYRVNQFGDQTLLGTVSESGGSVLDALPPLNVDFSYRVVVFAASGASTAKTVGAHVDSGGMEAWNFGPSASTAILLGLNASGSRSTQFSGETFHFALGPGTPALPTFYPDGDLDATGSHSYVVHGVEDYLRVRGVVEDPSSSVCWFRDAFGGRHTVHASWQMGYDAGSYDLFTVSASATEVVWEEPTS